MNINEYISPAELTILIISTLFLLYKLYQFWLFLDKELNEAKSSKTNKKYTMLSGFYSETWWAVFVVITLCHGYIFNNKIDNIYKQHTKATLLYEDYTNKLNNLKSNPPTYGTTCNDGWVSSSYGSGTCSHHGGIDRTYKENNHENYQYLSNKISEYQYIKEPSWYESKRHHLMEKHLWIQFFILVGLLWFYKTTKETDSR